MERRETPLVVVRATHRQIKAHYASVQHALTDEQRRAMRARITQLSTLVREAEDEAWRKACSPPDIRAAIRLAIARASTEAPVIAAAAMPRKRGLLAALSDAFKLT